MCAAFLYQVEGNEARVGSVAPFQDGDHPHGVGRKRENGTLTSMTKLFALGGSGLFLTLQIMEGPMVT